MGTEEQIAERPTYQVGDSPLRQMVRTIVDHVAALAEALEITQPIIARVVIEVRCSQDARLAHEPPGRRTMEPDFRRAGSARTALTRSTRESAHGCKTASTICPRSKHGGRISASRSA
jgi:hypothetical protein